MKKTEARAERPFPAPDRSFPVVGVGASAGGLEAFSNLLQHLGPATGMAFVLIQHLDPTHASFLREALAKTTSMPVEQAEDGMRIEPGRVYVIPPNVCLGIRDGRLTLTTRPDDPRLQHLPVDFFFRELAAETGSRAIGVVLSGTASDGTEGLRAIKAAEGMTFAQEPGSAKFSGMPQSAFDAGVVDNCLPIPELALELVRLARHPYVVALESIASAYDAATLQRVFAIVQTATRVDFSEYKSPTFERRLARRMALRKAETLPEYVRILETSPEEVRALYEDALIHVTSFFRDPEVFETLKKRVFPAIVKSKPERAPIRAWVAGCATGEEVYSLGIALVEFLGESTRPIQIFGSDLSSKAIETARVGLYPDSALATVSEERRRRYFTKVERGYRIAKSIRDLCVFVQHDLARDPPFSKLDLASCRNVLIYFDMALQKRVVATLHYALEQPGFLILGRAENVTGFRGLFEVVDRTNKIFARNAVPSLLRFAKRSEAQPRDVTSSGRPVEREERNETQLDLSRRLDGVLLGRYAPPGIVVNERMEILEFRGDTGAYLRPAPGEPQNNAMKMARDGLGMTLRATLAEAKKGTVPVRTAGVEVEGKLCDVVAIPILKAAGARGPLYVVLFEERHSHAKTGVKKRRPKAAPEATRERRRLPKLEQELAETKDYLQTMLVEHGRTNEDLGLANEELVSGNEELQSMNEELETAKEELQSINEELTTVNDELQTRNHEVTQINGDLVNLLTTVDIPILILDAERRIRRFTPKARSILNVVAADVGRPFEDIKPNIDVVDLDRQIAEVIETMIMRESEVQDRDGHWHRLQIRPYKTTENEIDGAIVSLFDIDALKHHIKQAELANAVAEHANQAKDDFLATLSHELRTPLSSILMRAQLLRRGAMDEARVKLTGAAIEAGVARQVRLIDDLLDVSKIVSGKLNIDLRPVDLPLAVRAAIEGMTPAVERKSLKLVVDISRRESVRVWGDEARLQQIVTNLLGNAIKFTPERGTVSVSLTIGEDTGIIRVEDTGAGIDAAFLPTMFNRFTQEDSTSTRAFGGLGLGLAIVRHLVELHHGTVSAESPGRTLGATFTVTLPLMKTQRPARSAPRLPGRGAPPDLTLLESLRILVVDDDRSTREAIAEMLARAGAKVRLAESASEAMIAVEEFRPELLLCDVAMPGEDGYAFIRKLRARGNAQAGAIPAVALTAMARDEDRERALAAGFQMHLVKPVDIDRLTDAVLELAPPRSARD